MDDKDLLTRMKKQIDNSEYLVATINKRIQIKSQKRRTIFGILSRARKINASLYGSTSNVDDILIEDIQVNSSNLSAKYKSENMPTKQVSKFLAEVKQGLANPKLVSDKIVVGVIESVNGVIVKRKSIPTFTPAMMAKKIEEEYGFKISLTSPKYSDYGIQSLSLFPNYQISPFSVYQENDQEAQQKFASLLKRLKLKVEYGEVEDKSCCLAKVDKKKVIIDNSLSPQSTNGSNILRVVNVLYAIANSQKRVMFADYLKEYYPDMQAYFVGLSVKEKANANGVANDISNMLVACNMARYIYDAETYNIIENAFAIKIASKLKFLQDKVLNRYFAGVIEANFVAKQESIFSQEKMDLLTAVNGYENKGVAIGKKGQITTMSQLLTANQQFIGVSLDADKNKIDDDLIQKIVSSKGYLTKLIQLKADFEKEFLSVDMRELLNKTKRAEFVEALKGIATKEIQDVQDRIDELKNKEVSNEDVLTLSSALLLRDLISYESQYIDACMKNYEQQEAEREVERTRKEAKAKLAQKNIKLGFITKDKNVGEETNTDGEKVPPEDLVDLD